MVRKLIEFSLTTTFPVSPEKIYTSWLDGDLHKAMTGGDAEGKAEVGTVFTAWDGYISGENLELVPNRRIVQSWRTTEFDDDAEDSLLEIDLKVTDDGCELTIKHSNIPPGQPDYKQGWIDFYFEPMSKYFK